MSGSATAVNPGGTAIPAGQIVSVQPSVLSAGGTALDLVGLLLTQDQHIPLGQVYQFNDLLSVQSFFGQQGYMAALAGNYFLADINATKRPGQLKVACYHLNQWVPASVMSAQMPGLTATMLQTNFASAGSKFSITMDGKTRTVPAPGITFNTTNAGSLSMAAWVIGAALGYTTTGDPANPTHGVALGNLTATVSGTQMTVTTRTGTVTPTNPAPNTIAVNPGQVITGLGIPYGTYIISAAYAANSTTTGVFTLASAVGTNLATLSIPTAQLFQAYANPCSWDATTYQFIIKTAQANNFGSYPAPHVPSITFPFSPSGTLVTQLCLTPETGAIINALGNSNNAGGYPMQTIAAYMDTILKVTQDWATFTTTFDPDGQDANGNPLSNTAKQQFASWANANTSQQRDNYMYVAWDNDIAATQQGSPAASTLARILNTNVTSGTCSIYSPAVKPGTVGKKNNGPYLAMFVMGTVAAIDFQRLNGRKTLAFKGQSGMPIDIINGSIATNLELNFYNYYGEWSTANDQFEFLYPGSVSGNFKWVDSYINQIWINNGFQEALMVLLTQVGSIPYNQAGYTLIKAACQDVINKAVHFGAIRPGVVLSELQKIEVNGAAGVEIDGILNQVGWYLQVSDVTDTQIRAARQSPTCTFWYMDGGSVQRISLASIMIQ